MMASRLLHFTPEEKQGRFYHESGRILAESDRLLRPHAESRAALPTITLFVALGTLVLTALLYTPFRKLLPDPGYRHHPGHLAGGRLDVISHR